MYMKVRNVPRSYTMTAGLTVAIYSQYTQLLFSHALFKTERQIKISD